MNPHTTTPNQETRGRVFFIMPGSLTWWVWFVSATLLAIGLAGYPWGFTAALVIAIVQLAVFWMIDRGRVTFPVQLRLAYTAFLLVCFLPHMRWLFWVPAVGTFALNIFGYCLMARCLSLLPWNREEPITLEMLVRTFLSRPSIDRPATDVTADAASIGTGGCPGGICSIEAQVRPKAVSP